MPFPFTMHSNTVFHMTLLHILLRLAACNVLLYIYIYILRDVTPAVNKRRNNKRYTVDCRSYADLFGKLKRMTYEELLSRSLGPLLMHYKRNYSIPCGGCCACVTLKMTYKTEQNKFYLLPFFRRW